jgi:hypothetical protein
VRRRRALDAGDDEGITKGGSKCVSMLLVIGRNAVHSQLDEVVAEPLALLSTNDVRFGFGETGGQNRDCTGNEHWSQTPIELHESPPGITADSR